MTKQSIKAYIDRILGNSLRVLLPSYWWKRAFGVVVDNMVTEDGIKTINGESVIGEGDLRVGVKNVESVEALEKLDAVVGDIATVGHQVLFSARYCYRGTATEIEEAVDNRNFERFTKICGVNIVGVPSEELTIFFGASDEFVYLTYNSTYGGTATIYSAQSTDGLELIKTDGTINAHAVEQFNERIKSKDYRYVGVPLIDNAALSDTTFDVLDSFFLLQGVTADAYIKGETWKRLLKEGDVTGGGESCSCTEEVIFYAADNTRGYSLTADEKAKNVEAFNKQWEAYQNKTPLNRVVCVRGDVTLYMPVAYFLPSNTSTLNVLKGATLEEYYVYVNSDGSATYSERKGLDEVLSTTSQNPVQNKVVTAALNDKADKSYVDDAVANVDFLSINANYDTFAEVKNMLNNAGVTGNSACYNYGLYYTPEGENNTMMETYMPPLYAYNTNSAWWIWCTRHDGSRHYFYAKEKYPKISNITVTGGIVRIFVGDDDSSREYNNNLNKRNFFQAEGNFPTIFDGAFFKVAFIDNANSFYESFVPVSITTPPLFTDDISRLYYTFTLFRNGNLETWKLMSDGSVEQTTL